MSDGGDVGGDIVGDIGSGDMSFDIGGDLGGDLTSDTGADLSEDSYEDIGEDIADNEYIEVDGLGDIDLSDVEDGDLGGVENDGLNGVDDLSDEEHDDLSGMEEEDLGGEEGDAPNEFPSDKLDEDAGDEYDEDTSNELGGDMGDESSEASGDEPETLDNPGNLSDNDNETVDTQAQENNTDDSFELRPLTNEEKDLYDRPSGFREGIRDEVWEQATSESTDGIVRDPLTQKPIEPSQPWDMGHKPGYEFRRHQQSAADRGIDRDQFLDEHNNPEHYRPELPSSNRSHAGEDVTGSYFGP